MTSPSEMFFEMLREDEAVSDKENDVTNTKQRLNEAADYLHDAALISATQGRTIVLAMDPETVELLSKWFRIEANTWDADEVHGEGCEADKCTAIASLKLADQLRVNEKNRP